MNKLIEVLEVQTYSKADKLMREYLKKEFATIEGVTWEEHEGNLYVIKGVAPYPCVVAHMDTVHQITEDLTAIVLDGKITGMNRVTMEQTGIGGDDKVGVYVALEMLREHTNIKAFFPRDEEIGCVGSAKVAKKWFDDVTIALQCDRRGNTDFITNASGTELSSKAFQDDVFPILKSYGYKFDRGMMTDVMELKERGCKPSMANISCGYYNPHTEREYVDIADVHKVTMMVSEIIRTLGYTYYPHELPKRQKWGETEFRWWEDDRLDNPFMRDTTQADGEEGEWCQDCMMKPATGPSGFCDECWDWYKKMNRIPLKPAHTRLASTPGITINYASKPDYGQSRIIPTSNSFGNIKKTVKEWKKKKKKRTI